MLRHSRRRPAYGCVSPPPKANVASKPNQAAQRRCGDNGILWPGKVQTTREAGMRCGAAGPVVFQHISRCLGSVLLYDKWLQKPPRPNVGMGERKQSFTCSNEF